MFVDSCVVITVGDIIMRNRGKRLLCCTNVKHPPHWIETNDIPLIRSRFSTYAGIVKIVTVRIFRQTLTIVLVQAWHNAVTVCVGQD